ncbi:PHD finger protein 23A-like isoform X1 [Schistocerca piceifrons]|uniref:PHD finger protein 23A-like isoform X1 n=1 Tax=Schistocerca piceifrons TaxID=274613 RepID=UPI001F5F626E|nr:PHD finger protein 23A-like isoform X1 [Schistocerca piceifrons]
MTDMILTGPDARKTSFKDDDESLPVAPKRARTSEDFYLFCKFILEYENYEDFREESDQQIIKNYTSSPLGSGIDQRSGRQKVSATRASSSRHGVSAYSSDKINDYSVTDSRSNTSQSPSDESGASSEDSHGRERFPSRSSKSSSSTSDSGDEEASSASAQDRMRKGIHLSDKSSYGLITCFCRRPYAGRPMIECSKCLTWMHLSCVKIKKSNIPEEFFCTKCKKNKKNKNSGDSEQSRTTLSRYK